MITIQVRYYLNRRRSPFDRQLPDPSLDPNEWNAFCDQIIWIHEKLDDLLMISGLLWFVLFLLIGFVGFVSIIMHLMEMSSDDTEANENQNVAWLVLIVYTLFLLFPYAIAGLAECLKPNLVKRICRKQKFRVRLTPKEYRRRLDENRTDSHHQSIFEEPHCDCFPDDGQVHNILEHSHPSAWLNFPFERKTFMAHPQRTSSSTTPENVFALDLSIVRKSDGKILKMVESSSFECEVEAPDGYLAPWIMYKRNLPGPALPEHTGFRPLGPREERSYRKIFAGLDAEYPDSFDEDSIEYEGQDPHPLVFEIRHVIFGITLASDDDDPFNERMVPLNSNEKLGMFLDMSRLEWM